MNKPRIRVHGTTVTVTWERQYPGLETVQEVAGRALKAGATERPTHTQEPDDE